MTNPIRRQQSPGYVDLALAQNALAASHLLTNDAAMITSEFMQTEQLTWRYDGSSVELAVD